VKNIIKILLFMFLVSDFSFAKSSFSKERLEEACFDYIRDFVGEDSKINIVQKVEAQIFDEDGVKAKIVSSSNKLTGVTPINIEFSYEDKVIRIVKAYFKISEFKLVPIASHTLKAGDIIQDKDFTMSKELLTQSTVEEFIDGKDLIGKTLGSAVTKNQQINKSMIAKSFKVVKGDKIKVIVESDGVQIATIGTALNDAQDGQTVRVQREEGKQILQGKVGSDGNVILNKR
jgi:flagella basal body P-ring formation protein FlgA